MKAPQRCPKHHIPLVIVVMRFCPMCRGEVRSKKKAAASRRNGRKGGRPVGSKDTKPRKRRKRPNGGGQQ